jgi:hypothetical protein
MGLNSPAESQLTKTFETIYETVLMFSYVQTDAKFNMEKYIGEKNLR